MSGFFPTFQKLTASTTLPGVVLQQSQKSGWLDALAYKDPQVKLQDGDKAVYLHGLGFRGTAKIGQSPTFNLPSADFFVDMLSTPVYIIQSQAVYSGHDSRDAARHGFSLESAVKLAAYQSFNILRRNIGLYGVKASSGEGLLNAAGIIVNNPPASSTGKTAISDYEPNEFAFNIMLPIVSNILSAMYQFGTAQRIVILSSQRVFARLQLTGMLQVNSYQIVGGGSNTIAGTITDLMSKQFGCQVDWALDDTLNESGALGVNGKNMDRIVITVPEIAEQSIGYTNEFASLQPNFAANNTMLQDMPAPRELITPVAGARTEVIFELLSTAGWNIRKEAIQIIEMPFSM